MIDKEDRPLVVDLDDEEARGILDIRLETLRSLPQRQQNAAILEELVTLTFTLQNAVTKMQQQTKDAIETESKKVREETRRTRRRVAFTIVTAVVLAFLATITANNFAIKHCFLGTNLTPHHSSTCNTIFPGYNHSIDQQRLLLAKFNRVLVNIPENKRRISIINGRLNHIEHLLQQIERGRRGG